MRVPRFRPVQRDTSALARLLVTRNPVPQPCLSLLYLVFANDGREV
jgi:hypothetical protein